MAQIGTYKLQNDTELLSIPIYDPTTVDMSGKNQLRIQTSANGVGCFELVDITATNASPWRVQTAGGLKAIGKAIL